MESPSLPLELLLKSLGSVVEAIGGLAMLTGAFGSASDLPLVDALAVLGRFGGKADAGRLFKHCASTTPVSGTYPLQAAFFPAVVIVVVAYGAVLPFCSALCQAWQNLVYSEAPFAL